MAMGVPDLNYTCSKCGHHGRGPRVTMADGKIVCPTCYMGDPCEGVSLGELVARDARRPVK
jgi:uncharacterized Zn finger protein (UPF0148 family)